MKITFFRIILMVLFFTVFSTGQVFAQIFTQQSKEKESALTVTMSSARTRAVSFHIAVKNARNRVVFPAQGKYMLLESYKDGEQENTVVIPLDNGLYTVFVYFGEDQNDYEAHKIPVELYNHKEAKVIIRETGRYGSDRYAVTKLNMKIAEDDEEAIVAIKAWKAEIEKDRIRKENFGGYFALTGSWYPYAELNPEWYGDFSTKTNLNLNNFGLSALMDLKFFKDYGAALDLKIDDPTFKKLVDFAGRLSYKGFLLGFNYHSFGGTVKWLDGANHPLPDKEKDNRFRTEWTTYSLMADFAYGTWYAEPYDMIGAFGISLLTFDIPLEHRVKDAVAVAPVSGTSVGLSFLFNYGGEAPSFIKGFYQWIHLNGIAGLTFFTKDKNTYNELSKATGVNLTYTDDDCNDWGFFLRANAILGVNKMWYVGYSTTIGVSAGIDFLIDWFLAAPELFMMSVGPAMRFSVRF